MVKARRRQQRQGNMSGGQQARAARQAAYACESLERRILLSTIHWANKGTLTNDSDGFNALFQGRATAARNVVQAAIDAWQRIISSFNYADGSLNDTYQLSVEIGPAPTPNAGGNGTPTAFDSDGKPTSGDFKINQGPAGQNGSVWYLDPTPSDSAEFTGGILGPFTALAGSSVSGVDLFSTTVHELGHCLGFTTKTQSAFVENTNHYLKDTGVKDPDQTPGEWWTFTGPDVTALMTTDEAGTGGSADSTPAHMAEIGYTGIAASYTDPSTNITYYEGRDLMVPAGSGWRQLPSLMDALILKDAYGYSIVSPDMFGTFYANFNSSTGQLVINGGQQSENNPYIPSADTINITSNASTLFVSVSIGSPVPGNGPVQPYVSQFPLSSLTSIVVDAGDGNDNIVVNAPNAGALLTVNGDDGSDSIRMVAYGGADSINGGNGDDSLNYGGGNLNQMVNARVNLGAGFNSLTVDDSAYSGAANYEVYNGEVGRSGGLTGNVLFDSSVSYVNLFTSAGFGDTVNVYSTNTPTFIRNLNAASVSIGNNGNAQGVGAWVSISNPIASTSITVDDSADPLPHNVTLTSTELDNLAGNAITWNANDVDGVTVFGGFGGNTYTVTSTPRVFGTSSNTIFAGDGNDTVNVNGTTYPITINGQNGADTITAAASGENLDAVPGLTVFGNSASSLILDDQNDPYTPPTQYQFTGDGGSTTTLTRTTIDGFGLPHPLSCAASGLAVVLNTGATPNLVDVEGDATAVTVNAGIGNLAVFVSQNAENLGNVPAAVTVHGNGVAPLLIEDQNDPSQFNTQVFLDPSGLSYTGFGTFGNHTATINYSGVAGMTFDGGPHLNLFSVLGTPTGIPVTLNTGPTQSVVSVLGTTAPLTIDGHSAKDTVILGSNDTQPGSLQGIASDVTVSNAAGITALIVDDRGDTSGHTVTITNSAVSGFSNGVIHYSQGGGLVGPLVVKTGIGDDIVNVLSLNSIAGLSLQLGAGNDTVNLGGTAPGLLYNLFGSSMSIAGGAGSDVLKLHDENDSFASSWTVTSAGVTGYLPGSTLDLPVNYSGLQSVEIDGGSGGTSYVVQSTTTPLLLREGPGNGNSIGDPGGSTAGIAAPVTLIATPGGGLSTLSIIDAGSSSPVTAHLDGSKIGSTAGDSLFGLGGTLNYAGISSVILNAPKASTGDSIFVTPSAGTSFNINAGTPDSSPGDALTIAPNGAAGAVFTPNGVGAGQYTFSNRQPITFTGVEQFLYDDLVPAVTTASSTEDNVPLSLTLNFNKNVAASLPAVLTAQNLTTGGSASLSRQSTPASTSATYTSSAPLPDGNYRITLPAGSVVDSSGNSLASDYTYDFFVLAGDANHDRHVDEADLAILNAHLGEAGGGGFSEGNFNYDNAIDATDTAILNANLHVWLPPQGPLSLPANAVGDNTYRLAVEASGSSMLDVYTSLSPTAAPAYRIPSGALSGLTIGGNGAGNDTLAIDLSRGFPFVPGTGIDFLGTSSGSGGSGVSTLRFIGSAGDDRIDINGNSALVYLQSSPVLFADLSWTSVQTIQFPGGSGGNDALHVMGAACAIDADTPSGVPDVSVTVDPGGVGFGGTFVTFATDQHLAALTITGGTAAMPAGQNHSLSIGAGGLSITGNGLLDLAAGSLLVDNAATPEAAVRQYLAKGYNADATGIGNWLGKGGITSSDAINSHNGPNPDFRVSVGYVNGAAALDPLIGGAIPGQETLPTSEILVRPALYGDLNLDGKVDDLDLQIFSGLGQYNNATDKFGWLGGDLNHDGKVDDTDLQIFSGAGNYNGPKYPASAAGVAAAVPAAAEIIAASTTDAGPAVPVASRTRRPVAAVPDAASHPTGLFSLRPIRWDLPPSRLRRWLVD